MTRNTGIALALLALTAIGCEAGFAVETDSDAIVGGAPTTGHPAVALIIMTDDEGNELSSCSGTLIAPDAVLTAAHCVDDPAFGGFFVYFGTTLVETDPGEIFYTWAREAWWHSAWTGAPTEGADIAILLLEEPAPVAPVPYLRTSITDAMVGAPVDLVGWGITRGGADDALVKRAVTSELFDYDDKFLSVGASSANTCSGDSGGPAFMRIGGVVTVVGVTSFGDAECADFGIDTRVDTYVPFIHEVLGIDDGGPTDDDSADDGGDAPGNFGATCSGGADCASGLCVDRGDGVGFCTAECASDNQCVDGFACTDTSSNISVCYPADDDGTDDGFERSDGGIPFGCSAGGDASGFASLLIVLALAGLTRRRRAAGS